MAGLPRFCDCILIAGSARLRATVKIGPPAAAGWQERDRLRPGVAHFHPRCRPAGPCVSRLSTTAAVPDAGFCFPRVGLRLGRRVLGFPPPPICGYRRPRGL